MLFNQSSLEQRFVSWVEFNKNALNLKDILLRSIEIDVHQSTYYLVPFNVCDSESPVKISLLSSWRFEHEYAYPTRFEISNQGTKNWLENNVIANSKRALFWVTDSSLNPLGHLGLLLNDHGDVEIDNVLKGVEGYPQLFEFAMLEIEKIVKAEFGVSRVVLQVLASNSHAIRFYERLNYIEEKRVGMKWEVKESSRALIPASDGTESLIQMQKILKNDAEVPDFILTAGPSISTREAAYVHHAVTAGWNSRHSDYIKAFESEFAEKLGVKHAMTTSSCTGALHLALLSLGIGAGDEVIVPDITWVATASAVAYTGATPVFADVDQKSWNLSVDTVKPLLSERTKAIIPVHLYGYGAPMRDLLDFANQNGLFLVEDAAPAIGTEVDGQLAGSFGDFGCFSFQGAKLLVTGEGGMLVTNNTDLYEKAWKIQDHGRKPGTFWIEELGYKYKMNNITAALGLAQIQRADVQIRRKREINNLYKELLSENKHVNFQEEIWNSKSICWMNSITLKESVNANASDLAYFLKENGVDTRPVFPTIHDYPMWKVDVQNQNASFISSRGLNLPSGVNLSDKSVTKVADLINKWFATSVD